MADREAQIEALWTYEISKEKVLIQIVKKVLNPERSNTRPFPSPESNHQTSITLYVKSFYKGNVL